MVNLAVSVKFARHNMVSFCEGVVQEVKKASTEVEIRGILISSINEYQSAHGNEHNSMLILNLIASMRSAYVENLKDKHASSSLLTAISVLRNFQQ